MRTVGRLGLLGGTFDPVHVGHVAAADAVRQALALDAVWLLTSHVPPHRPQPMASVHHRFAMTALAVQDHDALRASDYELQSPGPSFTSMTLARLHADGMAPSQLFFILGADAFAEIATWRDYPGILDAANFAVIGRGQKGAARGDEVPSAVRPRLRSLDQDTASAARAGATAVFLIDLPTPDVSSTAIRARCARRLPIAGMVPAAVEQHIHRHDLYAPAHGTSVERFSAGQLHEQEHF